MKSMSLFAAISFAAVLALTPEYARSQAPASSFLGRFNNIVRVASTVPANGDVNPYGVAVIRRSVGSLVRGNILVSNFNNGGNLQGTGTTIVQISPDGNVELFARLDPAALQSVAPDGIGLTTALVVLRNGWVIVGSLPAAGGASTAAKAGELFVLDSNGHVVEAIHGGPINGPWDMTAFDADDWAVLFVANVLNGTVAASPNVVNQGTVVRIRLTVPDNAAGDSSLPAVQSEMVIASGFPERTDPAALVIGPTGVGLGADGRLFVADTLNNRIQAIPNALFRTTDAGVGMEVSSGGALNGPLGLAVTPSGRILVMNSGDGNMVEVTRKGIQLAVKMVDTTGTGGGSLFGIAVAPAAEGVYFVNDGDNALYLLGRSR